MKRSAVLIAVALPAMAHVVSMSTGEARVEGARLTYELRIPLYEVAHVRSPGTALLDAMRFRSDGSGPRTLQRSCREDSGTFVCNASYEFPKPVDVLEVECSLPSITVPNHVHLLRAYRGDQSDQAAFDASFTTSELRFRPPTAFEQAVRDFGAGFWRAASGPAQFLFLVALILAARGGREMFSLAGMFAAGEVIAWIAASAFSLWISPRFLEAAAALTIAYVAVEVLALPNAGSRWAVAGVLGIIHGLYFSMILAAGNWNRVRFLIGVLAGEAIAGALLWAFAALLRRAAPLPRFRWQSAFASLLLAIGFGWFVLRLRS
jgi:HupE / UreJ protein